MRQILGAGVGVVTLEHLTQGAGKPLVDWLNEVQTPPAKIPRKKPGHFEPLLIDQKGQAIRDVKAWEIHRQTIRDAWLKFLGPMPTKRPPVKLKTLRIDQLDDCTRTLVRYEGEPGQFVEGYLLEPKNGHKPERIRNGKRPGIVALHQTTRDSIDEIAGVKGPEMQHLGLKFARRGYVVFCPRCFLWQNAPNYNAAVDQFRKRHPKTLGMHKMLYDAMRGVDVLASVPNIDATRLGAVGHSLGAKETFYLAAFDERIRSAVASEGGIGFSFTNWDAPWYLGKGIHAKNFRRNHHELIALIAPRPFLILAGEKGRGAADGDRTWPFLEAALPVYHLYGKPAPLGLLNHRQGHSIPPKVFERIAEWFDGSL
ncbi:MAG: prolyl oligopeptidase family serine peptidase [Planctomycetaceae bacterium]